MSLIIDGTNGLTFNNNTTQASAGQVLQVVSATFTGGSTNSTANFTDSADMASNSGVQFATASITPKFATSKILVQFGCQVGNSGNMTGAIGLFRNSTLLAQQRYWDGVLVSGQNNSLYIASYDSPATTSSVTYSVRGAVNNSLHTMNVGQANGYSSLTNSTTAAPGIILMEIAA